MKTIVCAYKCAACGHEFRVTLTVERGAQPCRRCGKQAPRVVAKKPESSKAIAEPVGAAVTQAKVPVAK